MPGLSQNLVCAIQFTTQCRTAICEIQLLDGIPNGRAHNHFEFNLQIKNSSVGPRASQSIGLGVESRCGRRTCR